MNGTYFLVFQGYDVQARTRDAALRNGLEKIPLMSRRVEDALCEARKIWQQRRAATISVFGERYPRHPKLVWAAELPESENVPVTSAVPPVRSRRTGPRPLKPNQYRVTVNYDSSWIGDTESIQAGFVSRDDLLLFFDEFDSKKTGRHEVVIEAVELAWEEALELTVRGARAILRKRGLRPVNCHEFIAFFVYRQEEIGEMYDELFCLDPIVQDGRKLYPVISRIDDDGSLYLENQENVFFTRDVDEQPTRTLLGVPERRKRKTHSRAW